MAGGYLPWLGRGGTYLGVPPPHPDLAGGIPTLDGGNYLAYPLPPHADLARGYLPWTWGGVPTLEYPLPPPVLTWPGDTYLGWGGTYLGVSTLDRGVPILAGVHPPPGVDRQTPVKTVPSRRTTYAGGKNVELQPFLIRRFTRHA